MTIFSTSSYSSVICIYKVIFERMQTRKERVVVEVGFSFISLYNNPLHFFFIQRLSDVAIGIAILIVSLRWLEVI